MYRVRINHGACLLALMIVASMRMISAISCKADTAKDPNASLQNSAQTDPNTKPIIIWHYHSIRDKPETLKLALSSGLITHVMLGGTLHRKDRDYKKQNNALEAIRIVKDAGAKLIWMRVLWPLYESEDIRLSDFFDPNYYINEIRMLRKEAKILGADYVALDIEVYAYSPMQLYWRGRFEFTPYQEELLINVMNKVLDTVGQIDFILPGGYVKSKHPVNILSKLGKFRIAEGTYWFDEKRIKNIQYEYEIFGAYVNTVRDDGKWRWPYFLVSDIFERSDLWSNRKGLFLYPREHNALAVAKDLVAYSKQLPLQESKEYKNSNSAQ